MRTIVKDTKADGSIHEATIKPLCNVGWSIVSPAVLLFGPRMYLSAGFDGCVTNASRAACRQQQTAEPSRTAEGIFEGIPCSKSFTHLSRRTGIALAAPCVKLCVLLDRPALNYAQCLRFASACLVLCAHFHSFVLVVRSFALSKMKYSPRRVFVCSLAQTSFSHPFS